MKRRVIAASTIDEATMKQEIKQVKEAMHRLESAMYSVHKDTLVEYDLLPLYDELQESLMIVSNRM